MNGKYSESLLALAILAAFVLLVLLAIIVVCCVAADPARYMPAEGIWYCEELQMRLGCETGASTSVVIDSQKILCTWGNEWGSPYLTVSCQDPNASAYDLGEVIFRGEIISTGDQELIVRCQDTDNMYIFRRIDQ